MDGSTSPHHSLLRSSHVSLAAFPMLTPIGLCVQEFKRSDIGGKGELDYHECMMLLERRGTVMTAKELMDMCADMDKDKNLQITFIELLCGLYQKSYDELFNFIDEEARIRAMEDARKFGEEAAAAEEEIERAKKAKELQAQLRAAALERESKLTGVAGMRAFFFRQVEGAQDVTKTNEQQIKEEAARRKALREAKTRMNEAILNANKIKSAAEVLAEAQAKADKIKEEEEAAARKKDEEEKAARAARKAALNAKWGGGGGAVPKPA